MRSQYIARDVIVQYSLLLADENKVKSIAFPLISTGGFHYPKEEAMRIAVDEINYFLLSHSIIGGAAHCAYIEKPYYHDFQKTVIEFLGK